MGYDEFITVFYVALALCIIMFVVSVVLFFKLRIIAVIGDLTGTTAKKEIESMREQNRTSGNKAHKPSPVNQARGKLTDKMTPSGKLKSRSSNLIISTGTGKIQTAELISETTVLSDDTSAETTVLETANETTVLSCAPETTVLVSGEEKAAESVASVTAKKLAIKASDVFEIEDDIIFTHTSEKID